MLIGKILLPAKQYQSNLISQVCLIFTAGMLANHFYRVNLRSLDYQITIESLEL